MTEPSIVDRSSLSRRPKKRGPFHLVPVMAKATLERLVIKFRPFQGKAVSHHHHPLRLSIPLPDQNRAGTRLGLLLVKGSPVGRRYRHSLFFNRSVQHLFRLVIEIAEPVNLKPIGDDCNNRCRVK